MNGWPIHETERRLVRLRKEGNKSRERMPELTAGSSRTCLLLRRRVKQLGMDRVCHYGFVGNVEGYHGLGHGGIQNYLSSLGCHGIADSSIRKGQTETKGTKEQTIA